MIRPLTSEDVVKAINQYMRNYEDFTKGLRSQPGLCASFDRVMICSDVMRMIRATGGKTQKRDLYFWPYEYATNHRDLQKRAEKSHNERMTYLAFLLAWIENP